MLKKTLLVWLVFVIKIQEAVLLQIFTMNVFKMVRWLQLNFSKFLQ